MKYPLWQIGCYQWEKRRKIADSVKSIKEDIEYFENKMNEVAAVPKECLEKKDNGR